MPLATRRSRSVPTSLNKASSPNPSCGAPGHKYPTRSQTSTNDAPLATSPSMQEIIDADERDDGTVLTHPLVTDVKITFSRRIWSDWKGGLVGALATLMLGLSLPSDVLYVLFDYRLKITGVIAPLVCFSVMALSNYTEHVLSPPVEPHAIVSFGGRSVFFTVNVIGTLLIYYSASLLSHALSLLQLNDALPPHLLPFASLLSKLTYKLFVPAYTLGTLLSVFYYAGVLTDKAEAANIRKWHRRGIPLARFLHTTHSTSILCVNIDLLFKEQAMVCEHMPPTAAFFVLCMLAYSLYYTTWVMVNYSVTKHFPYPFMNEMNSWKIVLGLLVGLGAVSNGVCVVCGKVIEGYFCGSGLPVEGVYGEVLAALRIV